jgi:methionyl aminopeptidase
MCEDIIIKTPEQIEKIKAAGHVLAELYHELKTYIKPGVSTLQIDAFADKFIKKHGGHPTFKSVDDYVHATCISVNNEVVHGIPRKAKIIQRGDILSVDCGVTLNGYIGDSTMTYVMPGATDKAKKLVEVTRRCLELGIEQCVPGNHIGDIGAVIQEYAESNGFSVVVEYVGHGTGVHLHEDPAIPHYGKRGDGLKLQEGMVVAIEPMINEGTYKTRTLSDGWTVVTMDGKLSCQFEHTVAITANGPVVLTSL